MLKQRRRVTTVGMLWLYIALAGQAESAQQPRTCIVYPFETDESVPSSAAQQVTERYAAALRSLGRFRVVSGAALQARLGTGAHERGARIPSLEVSAIMAARKVNAQFAVYGVVTRSGDRCTLETGIANVDPAKIMRIVRSHYHGSLEGFARLVPPRNVKTLLGVKESDTRPEKATTPKPSPGEPVPRLVAPPSPRPATPAPPRPITPPPPRPAARRRPRPAARRPSRQAVDWESLNRRGHELLGGRVEIGTRTTLFSLIKDHKDTFLGTIDQLDARQDLAPYKLFASWRFHPQFGVELTWDAMEVHTVTKWDGHSDGKLEVGGPVLSFFGRYPTGTRWTPYAALGVSYFSATFKPTTWWGLGYPSEEEYLGYGSPSFGYFGLGRHIDPQSAVGLALLAGCDIAIREHLSADVFLRYMSLDVDAHYYITNNGEVFDDRGTTGIPLDNIALGLGVRYAF